MAGFIPTPGTKGLYKLLEPFQSSLMVGIPYECIAVRRLADVIASGVEPYTTYYEPVEISKEDYAKDVTANVCLISLQASVGHVVIVPSSYIAGHPDIGGVPYTQLILAATLGPIPDYMDLSHLQEKVKSVVTEYIGIEPTINLVACSLQAIVSNDEHDRIEEARKNNISNTSTDYAKYLDAQAKLEAATTRIRELERYILTYPKP